MSYSICLDTCILLSQTKDSEKLERYREKYDELIKNKSPLTEWEFLLFSDHSLIISPYIIWEYICNRVECYKNDNLQQAWSKAKKYISILESRFKVDPRMESMTVIIGYLFGSVTGVSCDDAINFIYAVKKSADYFATRNTKDFKFLKNQYKKLK